MPVEAKLKPCPFCGGAPIRMNLESMHESCISCSCGASSRMEQEKSEAVEKNWNRRTPEPGTSVIRWTCYDGTQETLPRPGCVNYVILSRKGRPVVFDYLVYGGYGPRRCEWWRCCGSPELGDTWAYLPNLPEGME